MFKCCSKQKTSHNVELFPITNTELTHLEFNLQNPVEPQQLGQQTQLTPIFFATKPSPLQIQEPKQTPSPQQIALENEMKQVKLYNTIQTYPGQISASSSEIDFQPAEEFEYVIKKQRNQDTNAQMLQNSPNVHGNQCPKIPFIGKLAPLPSVKPLAKITHNVLAPTQKRLGMTKEEKQMKFMLGEQMEITEEEIE